MKVKVAGSELNRMMKVVTQCIETKVVSKLSNVEIGCGNNLLTVRGTNGSFQAMMSTPYLCGEEERFCVDGQMLAKVISVCGSGDVEITTDGKTCTVKGVGRTKIPVVNAEIPEYKPVKGKEIRIAAEDFGRAFSGVQHSISSEQTRLVLTGVLIETEKDSMRMVALDGFRMSIEDTNCTTDETMRIVVPGAFMKLISSSTFAGETVTIRTDGKRLQVETDGMMIACSLLAGEYVDYAKLLPQEFKTESLVNGEQLRVALKSGSAVNNKNNLVKIDVGTNRLIVTNNGEHAEYEAEVSCETQGNGMLIAFNEKYLIDTINSMGVDEIVMKLNSPISPCIMQGKDGKGMRLLLPVRVMA